MNRARRIEWTDEDMRTIMAPIVDPETALIEQQSEFKFHDLLLRRLQPKIYRVLAERFGLHHEAKTLEVIGRELGISKERVRQINAKGLRQLRHPKTQFEIAQLFDAYTPTTRRGRHVRHYVPIWIIEQRERERCEREAEERARKEQKAAQEAARAEKRRQTRMERVLHAVGPPAHLWAAAWSAFSPPRAAPPLEVVDVTVDVSYAALRLLPDWFPSATPAPGRMLVYDNGARIFVRADDLGIFMSRYSEVVQFVAQHNGIMYFRRVR